MAPSFSNVYLFSGVVVSLPDNTGTVFDQAVSDFTVLGPDPVTAQQTASTYLGEVYPNLTAINFTGGAPSLVAQNVVSGT